VQLRLLIGTGFCGGFTTYSALAGDTVVLAVNGAVGASILYAVGTVLVGALATWAGIAVGVGLRGGRGPTVRGGGPA
jgi:CrcB protein